MHRRPQNVYQTGSRESCWFCLVNLNKSRASSSHIPGTQGQNFASGKHECYCSFHLNSLENHKHTKLGDTGELSLQMSRSTCGRREAVTGRGLGRAICMADGHAGPGRWSQRCLPYNNSLSVEKTQAVVSPEGSDTE